MLQAIRSRATSFVVKILFGLLIVTFGIWGIGDIFRNNSGTDTSVATVGGRKIEAQDVSKVVQQQIQQMESLLHTSVDAEQAKQLGIVDKALQNLIATNLVELEIGRLNLAIGDQAVRDQIMSDPAFHNSAGVFDRNLYAQILAANQMSEPQFETLERGEILKNQLVAALSTGMTAPKPLVDALYRMRAEERTADIVTLPDSAAGTLPAPSQTDLEAYYKSHQDSFQSPELRSFKVAELRLDDIAAGTSVSDDQLKQAYAQHKDDFQVPETRKVSQMLLPDEAAAKTAQSELMSGKTFAAVAKDVAKMDDPSSLDLGWVKKGDLPPELADAAFTLKDGEVSQPIKSTFGWHILRIDGVKPGETQTFDQVKDKLHQQVARDQASDHMADLANSIDDAIAGGANLDDVAKKFSLKVADASEISADGKDAKGQPATLPGDRDAIAKTAFATDRGQMSPLAEMGDNGYYLVQVNAVTPAAPKPLADVHDEVAKAVQDAARQKALQQVADAIVQQVGPGKTLKDVAAARGLSVSPSGPLKRDGGGDAVPASLVAKLFDAKDGAAVAVPTTDGMKIAQVTAITPADPAKDPDAVKALSQQLDEVMQADVLGEYDKALRQTFPVEVDQSNLDHLL